jgi:hypothetical protein
VKTVDLSEIGPIDKHLGVGGKLQKDIIGRCFACEMTKYIVETVADYYEARPTPAE